MEELFQSWGDWQFCIPVLLSFPRLKFPLSFLTCLPLSALLNRAGGMSYCQSVTFHLCCSFSLCSSHAPSIMRSHSRNTVPHELFQHRSFSTASEWILSLGSSPSGVCCSYRLQFWPENCFSVGSLHGPWVLSGACFSLALRGLQFPLGHLLMLWFGVLHVLAGWIFAPLWTSSAVGEQASLSHSSLLAAMEFLLWCLQKLCPFLLQWPWHLQSWFSDVFSFSLLSCQTGFLPFPKYVITEVHWCHLWVQPGTAVGLSNTGQLLVSSHRAHPCQNLALNTYSCSNSRAICFFKCIPYGFDAVLRGYWH